MVYGIVWYVIAWYGMVWYGTVWYGTVWYGTVRYGTVRCGVRYGVRYGTVLYGMAWYGVVWCTWYVLVTPIVSPRCNHRHMQSDGTGWGRLFVSPVLRTLFGWRSRVVAQAVVV